MTKAKLWEYEAEWRIIDPDNGRGKQILPAEMLTGVIFGCDMILENRQLIREWVKGRKTPFTFYEAKKKEKEFGLDIVLDSATK